MKTVLFVITSLEVGGIETYLARFLKFSQGKFRAIVLCRSGRGGKLVTTFERFDAQIVYLDLGRTVTLQHWNFLQLLRHEKVDVICDFTGDFAGPNILAAMLSGVRRRITFYRESDYQFRKSALRVSIARFLGYIVSRCSTNILSNSETALDKFHPGWRHNQPRAAVLRNPAPIMECGLLKPREVVRSELGVPENAFLIVHTGRVTPAKNHATILEVAATSAAADPDLYFVLCGRGLNATYGDEIKHLKMGSRIQLFEDREDVLDVVAAADAFYFPSLNEGMPNSLLEAMTLSIPCISSDIPAIREIFPASYDRFLLDPRDTGAAIEKIGELKKGCCREFGEDLGDWARSEFSLEKTFGAFLKLILK